MARCAESNVSGGGDGKGIAIANGDTEWRGRVGGGGEYTRVGDYVRGCAGVHDPCARRGGADTGGPAVVFRAATRAEQSHAGPGV